MKKILIVDDEAHCLDILAITFRDEGYRVETAQRGIEAIEKGMYFQPDILISDWKLRDVVDGIEVARTLQRERSELKVILFSGYPSNELRTCARNIDFIQTFEKPLRLDEVLEAVQNATSSIQIEEIKFVNLNK